MKRINPVLVRGIKSRMRGVRAPILMCVYFVILLGIFSIVYASQSYTGSYYSVARPRAEGSNLLSALFSLVVVMIFVFVVMMVPAMNAGNIASEREKQTLDLLLSSRLSAISIVQGKLFSNLAFMTFLLILSLPLFAVMYLFGSILILDILKIFLFMVVSAYGCASVATFFSALMKKTSVATILTYVALLLFVILTLVGGALSLAYHVAQPNFNYEELFVPWSWRINPIFSVLELVTAAGDNTGFAREIMMSLSRSVTLSTGDMGISFLPYSTVFIVLVSVALNIFSAVLVKPVRKFQLR